ncbi:zinc-dependent alcohol dehydrogenase [Acidisoma cellulosilytica]|uniref:alcohol dehydrogenase n=1 Tax=Acidisoma cellulosilyticum TaxID=2802395 RepID=A0A963YZV4_9PROT|nr:zinc-dependent alcohol dehydrogenase [Acidisoma cellulosilyticum]MCB8879939.1 zinc-dependent alcohol dehydrogenase [Acidisoma cellulosilyticum]
MAGEMTRALMRQMGAPLVLGCDSIPTPGPGEVLIRVAACGVCHSDLHIVDGDWGMPPKLPLIPGHEVVGEVISYGPDTIGPAVGAIVGVAWNGGACGHCRACLEGDETICRESEGTGFSRDGGYADYIVARAAFVVELPKDVDAARFAPVLCAGVTTYRGLKRAQLRPGAFVAVIGCGGLGQMAVQYARAMGFRPIAVDLDAGKLELATRLGAVATVKGDVADLPAELRAIAGEAGLRAAIVVAPALSAFTAAIAAISPGGAVIFIALPAKDRDTLPVSISTLANFEKRLIGSNVGTRADLMEAVELALTAGILADVETMPLAEANAALDRLRRGQVPGRLVLTT